MFECPELGCNFKAEQDYRQIAEFALRLIFSSRAWINRRVDSVSFSDPSSMTRRTSIDCDIPGQSQNVPKLSSRILIPIAMLRKSSMVNFSTQDEQNRTWSLSALTETKEIERFMLDVWSHRCSVRIPGERRNWYSRIIDANDDDVSEIQAIDATLQEFTDENNGPDQLSVNTYHVLAKLLARDRILFARLYADEGNAQNLGSHVLKLTYDRPLAVSKEEAEDLCALSEKAQDPQQLNQTRFARFRNLGHTVGERLGNVSNNALLWFNPPHTQFVITASNATYAKHYHLELTVPEDIAITKAALYDEIDGTILGPQRDEPATRCDLYGENHEVLVNDIARAFFQLQPIRRLWTHANWLASLAAVVALVAVGAAWTSAPKPVSSSRVADTTWTLLVAFTSVLFMAVIQPEENNFSRFMLRPFRRLALWSAGVASLAIALGGALLIAEEPDAGGAILISGGGICFFIMAAQFWQVFAKFTRLPILKEDKESGDPEKDSKANDRGTNTACIESIAKNAPIYYQPHRSDSGFKRWERHEHFNLNEKCVCNEIIDLLKDAYPASGSSKDWLPVRPKTRRMPTGSPETRDRPVRPKTPKLRAQAPTSRAGRRDLL